MRDRTDRARKPEATILAAGRAVSAETGAVETRPPRETAGLLRRLRNSFGGIPKLATLFLLAIVVAAIFAGVLAPDDPADIDFEHTYAPPVWDAEGTTARLLGGDSLGRDILSRIIHGARISLIVGLGTVTLTSIVGTAIGIVAGYRRGVLDTIISGVVDLWLSIPAILFLLLLALIIGRNIIGIIIAIAVLAWPRYARIVRGQVLSVRGREFVAMARVSGSSARRIMFRHILPNIASSVIVLATLDVGRVIVLEASLSFLGLGVIPPTPAWGVMVAEGQYQIQQAWWVAVMPGIALVLTVLSANSLGDWLRDTLDPTGPSRRVAR